MVCRKMAMHDVEAGKFGMNFQGIGKEQVRLGFIRFLGFCGRYALQDFFWGGDGGSLMRWCRKKNVERNGAICWLSWFLSEKPSIFFKFLDLKSKRDGWRLTFLLASRTWTYAQVMVNVGTVVFFWAGGYISCQENPTSSYPHLQINRSTYN